MGECRDGEGERRNGVRRDARRVYDLWWTGTDKLIDNHTKTKSGQSDYSSFRISLRAFSARLFFIFIFIFTKMYIERMSSYPLSSNLVKIYR